MEIKDKKLYLWGFTEKSDFQGWVTKKNIIKEGFSTNGELGQFADLRGGLTKKGGVVEGGGDGEVMPKCTLWEIKL